MDEKQRALEVLEQLDAFPKGDEISIIRLSEPILATASLPPNQQQQQRTSDVSNSSLDAPTPASLDADLAHYRELFAKLRFSYVEQVTKEKFIRAIVGDPPIIVTPQENLDLERANAAAKAELQALKAAVRDMVADLDANGRQLARRLDAASARTAELRALPAQLAALEADVAALEAAAAAGDLGGTAASSNPELHLPLGKTADLVEARRAKAAELDRRLEQLEARALPRKRKELERLAAERGALEAKRHNSAAAAAEAKRKREAKLGGAQDDLEERGRWWRANEAALRHMLEIEG